jgi:hypothetical protein
VPFGFVSCSGGITSDQFRGIQLGKVPLLLFFASSSLLLPFCRCLANNGVALDVAAGLTAISPAMMPLAFYHFRQKESRSDRSLTLSGSVPYCRDAEPSWLFGFTPVMGVSEAEQPQVACLGYRGLPCL